MSHRPGIGTGNPGRDIKQVAKPIRVIKVVRDATMSPEDLAACSGTEYRGEVRS